MKVKIILDNQDKVVTIEGNEETEQYKKADVKVGDKLDKQLIALFLMNPHRFDLSWDE